ncbi:hypothetical protein [Alkalicoccus chagannorensis]|uniref:hypothetical protein n=1 Tax=Alkalicoccus chagannorensis TaxID=427072 RepID=UPI0004013630|nr:hypothetical protein [Alkalicoccus chagannorensis]
MEQSYKDKLEWGIRAAGAALLLFAVIYFIYYFYIAAVFGLREGLLPVLIGDAVFLLFIPAGILLLLLKPLGWWLAMASFCYLLLAKTVSVLAGILLDTLGIAPEGGTAFQFSPDVLQLVLYGGALILLSVRPVRHAAGVQTEQKKFSAFWYVFPPALLLYAFYFYASFQQWT